MKYHLYLVFGLYLFILITHLTSTAQDTPVKPVMTGIGTYHGLTPPLRDIPPLTEEEWQIMVEKAERKLLNPKLRERHYPFAETALPTGPDPVWQKETGATVADGGIIMNFSGQTSPYFPPDANGAAGPLYYMQSINTVYAIYHKESGAIAAGPTNMNQLFSGVTGANCNDGDPLILYDEMAQRWLAVAFSICGPNDRMLVAVSQTSDPTGSWHKYSFDVDDMPDYPKFGIWPDGYYMGTNNSSGKDIYVFERDQMLVGGTAQMAGFDNPWRPTTIDGFMCVPPLDNDGPAAPAGSPGLFITINDDAIAGGSDQLWIYELSVDWSNPSNATFDRVQQISVPPFDSNFGPTWNNIRQPGTSQRLDAIPMVIMNRPQYRNFGAYETIVCCHTVDLDATDHAGIRWYELRRTGGAWTVRQTGTFGPDEHNRWMGSISLNGSNEIGLAYSISSVTEYPGLRFTGQSAAAYAAGEGVLDIAETIIHTGINSQLGANRWGDYADLCVDPDNDHTFWFSSQYGGNRMTKIASFEFAAQALSAMFSASNVLPCIGSAVSFSDQSTGVITSWEWTFQGGDPATSTQQNPVVTYNQAGTYDVQLAISDGVNSDTLFIPGYITVVDIPEAPGQPVGPADVCSGSAGAVYQVSSVPGAASYEWSVIPAEAGAFSGSDTLAELTVSTSFTGEMQVRARSVNDCGYSIYSENYSVVVHPGPDVFSLEPDGGYCEGDPGFEIVLSGSQINVTYELLRDGVPAGVVKTGTGSPLSFGYQSQPGAYTVTAQDDNCSLRMSGATEVYLIPGPEISAPPTGSTQLCNSVTGTEYATGGAANASYYIWHLSPPEAGTISGTGTTATVEWNAGFAGAASVSVRGADECGTGPVSDALEVNVLMAPHPVVSGNANPCHSNLGAVYFYSTPGNPNNSYQWSVTGGTFITGQGTSQAMVSWTFFGPGSIRVMENAPNGCSTTSIDFQVIVHDCTGIPETDANHLMLYPNPVEDELVIKAEKVIPGTFQLKIYNSFGQPVILQKIRITGSALDLTVSTASLSPGVYSVKLIGASGKVYEGKFVKTI
ncbi:MAG: PKD domain-containing protein [Bacteroidales bacterium]